MVTGNWLDSLHEFIKPVTIYIFGKGLCSDVMAYITIAYSESEFDSKICVQTRLLYCRSLALKSWHYGNLLKNTYLYIIRIR